MRTRLLTIVLASALALTLAACSQAPSPSADGPSGSDFLARANASAASLGVQAGHTNANGYGWPLYDLATAPNGDLLVADFGQGVMLADDPASLLFALPGATAVGPIGRTSMWATTSTNTPDVDSGQAIWRVGDDGARRVANLFAFEDAYDPDGAGVDSNPYAVATVNGNEALVIDAGGNTLLRVDNRGDVELVATFPPKFVSTDNLMAILGCPEAVPDLPPELAPLCFLPPGMPAQAVPTSVAIGPDGAYYVGELIGFPAPLGESRIWRVDAGTVGAECGSSPACTVVADGFTSIVDLVFGPDGRFYVVEIEATSWISTEAALFYGLPVDLEGGAVHACAPSFGACDVVIEGVPLLTAVGFDKDGTLWGAVDALIPPLTNVVPLVP